MKIINKSYNINGEVNSNITLISDIHYYSKTDIKHLNKILDKIKVLRPDYICIPGDITDEAYIKDEDEFIKWLIKLSSIAKVIVSLGNHEFYKDCHNKTFTLNDKFIDKIKKLNNLFLLDNECKLIDNINFIGLTIPLDYYMENKSESISINKYVKINNSNSNYNYNILLIHSPINIANNVSLKDNNIDLVLCGHMHGGITPRIIRPLFKNRGIISPNKKLFPKNAYGYLKINNINILITSGIKVVSHTNKFRFLSNMFSSEIVNINIKKC